MREAHTRTAAEARLHAVVPREWRWSSTATIDGEVLLAADRAGTLINVDIDLLTDIVKDIEDDASAFIGAAITDAPGEPSTESSPQLRIMASIGSSIDAGQEIFILKDSESYSGDRTKLQRRLMKTLRWKEQP